MAKNSKEIRKTKSQRKKKIYKFLSHNRGRAYTTEELKDCTGLDEIVQIHSYTTFKPFRYYTEREDGKQYHWVEYNPSFLIFIGLTSVVGIIFGIEVIHTLEQMFVACDIYTYTACVLFLCSKNQGITMSKYTLSSEAKSIVIGISSVAFASIILIILGGFSVWKFQALLSTVITMMLVVVLDTTVFA